jgi:hypothetical protein
MVGQGYALIRIRQSAPRRPAHAEHLMQDIGAVQGERRGGEERLPVIYFSFAMTGAAFYFLIFIAAL